VVDLGQQHAADCRVEPMAAVVRRVSIRSRARDVPRAVYVVLAVALAVRLAWVTYAAREPQNFGDPFIYLNAARGIAQGHGYVLWFSTHATAFHPIGYPGWLAIIVWSATRVGLDGHVPVLVGLAQAVLGTASVALVYAIGVRLFDHRVALIAAAITACFPNLVFYTAIAYSETLYLFGILLAIWLVLRVDWKPAPTTRVIAAFGFVVGLSSLVRPFTLLSPLLLGVAMLRSGANRRDTARAVTVAMSLALLVLVPWTVRNAFTFHAFVPVSTNLGDTLCLDNSAGAYGGFRDLPPECSPPVTDAAGEPARNSHNLRYAVRWAVRHPLDELGLVARRTYYGYRSDHDALTDLAGASGRFPPSRVRTPLSWLADIYYFVVGLLAIAAVPKFWREPRRFFVLLMAASLAVVPLYLYGLVRFHIPLLPFLALGAAVTIDGIYESAKRRKSVI
jgi:4-amino-4-deoxy-L-arabinose transferase-like glycosyltransferase